MHLELWLIVPVVLFCLLLVMRRIVWWYWGLDRWINALEDIAVSLRTFPSVQAYDRQAQRRPPRAA